MPSDPWVPPSAPRVPLQPSQVTSSQKPLVLVESTPPSSGFSDPSPLSQYPAYIDPLQPPFARPTSSVDSRSYPSHWPSTGPPSELVGSHHSQGRVRAVTPDQRRTQSSPQISPTQPTLTPQRRSLRQPVARSTQPAPLFADIGSLSGAIARSTRVGDGRPSGSALLPSAVISSSNGRRDSGRVTPSRDINILRRVPSSPSLRQRDVPSEPVTSFHERGINVRPSFDAPNVPPGASKNHIRISPLKKPQPTPTIPASASSRQAARLSSDHHPVSSQFHLSGRSVPGELVSSVDRARDGAKSSSGNVVPQQRMDKSAEDFEQEGEEGSNTDEEAEVENAALSAASSDGEIDAKVSDEGLRNEGGTEESFMPGVPDGFGIARRKGSYASVSPAKSRRKRARAAASTRNKTHTATLPSQTAQGDDEDSNVPPSDNFRVVAPWGREHFFLGTVTRARSSGKCDVRFDDGDIQRAVHVQQLRSYPREGDSIWVLSNPVTSGGSAIIRKDIGVNKQGNYQLRVQTDDGDAIVETQHVRISRHVVWDDDRLLTLDDIPPHLFRASSPLSTRSGSIRRTTPRIASTERGATSLSRASNTRASTSKASAARKPRFSGGYVKYEAVPDQQPRLKDTKCFAKVAIIATGMSSEARTDLTSRVRRAGGRLYDSWDDIIEFGKGRLDLDWKKSLVNSGMRRVILISSTPMTTAKYLMALALRIPCVSERWVYDRLGGVRGLILEFILGLRDVGLEA